MLSSLFRFPAGLCGAAILALSLPAMGQTISNPGFEKDLSDWAAAAYDHDMSQASSEAAHSGKLGLRVKDEDPKYSSSLESLPAEATPGQKYEVTFWARTVAGEGDVAVSLRFCDDKGKALQKKAPKAMVQKAPEWKQYTITGIAPPGTAAFLIWIHTAAPEPVTADLDDFEIKAVP